MNKNKKAIIVAGQSNTHTSNEFGYAPVITGSLDMSIKHLGRDLSNFVPLPAGMSNISFQGIDGYMTSYAYPLAKRIKDDLHCQELLIIPCAVGGTGWSNNRWSADGDLYQDMIARVRYAIEVLGCEIVGCFWSQGEADTNQTFAPIYSHLLDSLAMTIRDVAEAAGQANARAIPFVTFDMVAQWVGNDPNRNLVQAALEGVGERIPFAANIDTDNLPTDLDGDVIHYDTRQIMEIGHRMYSAWKVARRKNNDHLSKSGEYLVHTLTNDEWYHHKWEALYYGDDPNAGKYSRLGEIWKYRQNQKYHFRLTFDIAGKDTQSITFEQAFIPFMFEAKDSPASLISIPPDTQYGGPSGFPGLYYPNIDEALLGFSGGNQWFLPCGQTNAWGGGIPVSAIPGQAAVVADQLRLYAIVL